MKFIIWGSVLALLIILGITFWASGSNFSSFPSGLVAWGTLMLAAATFMLIRHSKELEESRREAELSVEKRDREERLLNEIIEWAMNVFKNSTFNDMATMERDIKEAKDLAVITVEEWKAVSKEMVGKNQYISTISLNFNEDLQKAVSKLIDALKEHLGLLTTSQGRKVTTGDIAKGKLQIYKLANIVIKEAVNLMTRDIG